LLIQRLNRHGSRKYSLVSSTQVWSRLSLLPSLFKSSWVWISILKFFKN